jgi:hypothetical protein
VGDATTPVDQAAFWTRAFCWQASALAGNVRWLFERNLATLFGWRVEPLAPYVRSTLTTGASWAWMPLAGTCLLALAATIRGNSGRRASPGNRAPAPPGRWFPIYLVLVGLQSAVVYAGFGCLVRDPMLLRYTLLALFVPVGATAWLFVRAPSRIWRLSAFACVALWALSSAVGHLRVIDEYARHRPPSPYRALATFLEEQGVRYARAPYWTAYHLDFLTRERVTVASYDVVRIDEYERIVDAHEDRSAGIFETGSCGTDTPVVQWCIAYLERAKGAR